ncbi:YrbE family protein [Gordonia araii NBRC 100433]|uniref:YrbE family protein n=1 Tax=Gordonia araii NBRC 100433 TaxID=1073574 RepID=G7GY09_9ACTN|nr:ABC transporter permease [Gordonia araii]NNG98095.1 ABC transporter permease [Gordonia araii NBRC 100433]GAB08484.1 YrbE family protein [Gordonia araii NBRC 100433]
MAPSTHTPPGRPGTVLRAARQVVDRPATGLAMIGHQFYFVTGALRNVPVALTRYWSQVLAHISSITFGNGSIIVGGGMLGVLVVLGAAVGGTVGIQGFALLDMVNMGPLTGFVSGYATTRELGPMIVAVGFAAQVGCRITAEVGAMRISEEIDALEASAIHPLPFVVSSRIVASVLTIVPLHLLTLAVAYLSCEVVVSVVHDQPLGTYQHYFTSFVSPVDVLYSVVKVVAFIVAIVLIHSYQGFYASGGPEGVGVAAGRAIRASLVIVVVLDMVLTLLIWGFDSAVRISG